ncbi:hypothetical protein CLOP_g20924 [Closterium sp. NIES-67]|nr:hypothetical protein CLOP_g20924 [Closterium sp. NIES-67]
MHERRQLFDELRAAKERADEANRAKSTFLATMSHEIRTPMNAVIGMLELTLKRADQGHLDRPAIEVAYNSAKDLLELIGDILDIARIESGRLSLAPERVNLREVIESVVRVFDGLARQKTLSLILEFKTDLDDTEVLIDPLRFKQVLSNLISNAIKFTERGQVKIKVDVLPTDLAQQVEMKLVVEDTGIGISRDDQMRLFEPFAQADNSGQLARSGAGLGLVICRSLCAMMGGQLSLSSVPMVGTQVHASNQRLSQSNDELEAAKMHALGMAQARAAFLANMSHEIRTPLNGLLGMIALSLDSSLNAEQRQQLSIAHDSGKVLVELLNDILDLSKFDAGQLELERIPFDLGALVEDTANLLSQNAAPSVELTCLIDPRFPAQVLGDPTRVRQIVSNLLSNALKFTRFGRVDVRLSVQEGKVHIEVCDTGIGIAQEAQVKIFQPFTQAGAGITRQFGGTGLGLALTRNLCEAMQGRLSISSEVGFGSQFCAELPLPAHLPAMQPPPLSVESAPVAHRARILLVEDNPVNQLVAKGMLSKLGCEVVVAGHGGVALKCLEEQHFDMVLMDCNMPVMDGYEASRQIRSSGRWPDLPIVALTANAMSEERERCRAAGMNDYLAKPFRREELNALLDLWVPKTTAL